MYKNRLGPLEIKRELRQIYWDVGIMRNPYRGISSYHSFSPN
ncbi:hypothetical protein GCM10027286_00670 [Virgibacillus ainsalahensis]